MNIKEGDIFITKLERDFFGAFRILKANGRIQLTGDAECLLVGITTYVKPKVPVLTDKELTEILIEKRFFCNNKPSIGIRSKKGIEKFEFLGNIPLSKNEKGYKIEVGDGSDGRYPFYGAFDKNFGYNAFLEWRWENEREEFEAAVAKNSMATQERIKASRARPSTPAKMLDEDSFWEVIDLIDSSEEDDDKKMQPAIHFLAKKKVAEIQQFEENLSCKLYQLDTQEHAGNIGEQSFVDNDTHFSTDYFLYVRCYVVANGKHYFDRILDDPKEMPENREFEPLLYLAQSAYEMKMRKPFGYRSGYNYETFSNRKGWE